MVVGPIDDGGIIPPSQAAAIITAAEEQSAVLQLARRVPMPTGQQQMPVQTGIPQAGWVTAATGGRKPYTDMAFNVKMMTAEEIAAIVAIPQSLLDDSSINLWDVVRPQVATAIAVTLDATVLFGTNAPATFPPNGITDPAHAQTATAGVDVVDTVNTAMGLVETQGLPVTGSTADLEAKAHLRGVRDSTGALLLGPAQITASNVDTLYGVPIVWTQFPVGEGIDYVTGDWDALTIGVRQDITWSLTDSGVIADATGKVLVSAFQDDMVLMRVYARFGCIVVNPPTNKIPAGAKPFAMADLTAPAGGATRQASRAGSSK